MKKFSLLTYFLLLSPLPVIFYFWLTGSGIIFSAGASSVIISIARISGLLAVYSILLQIFLRARVPLLENVLGFETLNSIHKKNGYIAITLILLHPTLLTIGYAIGAKQGIIQQFTEFLFQYPDVLKAFLAVLIFIGVVGTSIYIVRKNLRYEYWYYIHIFTYLAVLFAWGHQLPNGADFAINKAFVIFWYVFYGIVALSVLYWRFGRELFLFWRYRFYLLKVVRETSDTVSIYLGGKGLSTFNFDAGQFAFVRFVTPRFMMESHPFSFSISPNKDYLRFTVKDVGDFTKAIAEIPVGTPVVIDGPHGNFTYKHSNSNKYLFLAAGVGITPIRSLIEAQVDKDVVMFYSSKTDQDVIFKKELDELMQQRRNKLYYVTSKTDGTSELKGRIDLTMIEKYASDYKSRDIYICGPQTFIQDISHSLLTAGIARDHIHSERFSL